jgi:hypothetical protein
MVERFHRQLKAALRSKLDAEDWVHNLPMIMLGIRSAVKEDIGCSASQLVFGAAPRLPMSLAQPTITMATEPYLRHLQEVARNLKFTQPDWHGNTASQTLEKLSTATFVNIRSPPIHPTLDPQYSGPHRVLERQNKFYLLDRDGREEHVSVDRLIPAPQMAEVIGQEDGIPPPNTTRTGRPTRRPQRFLTALRHEQCKVDHVLRAWGP